MLTPFIPSSTNLFSSNSMSNFHLIQSYNIRQIAHKQYQIDQPIIAGSLNPFHKIHHTPHRISNVKLPTIKTSKSKKRNLSTIKPSDTSTPSTPKRKRRRIPRPRKKSKIVKNVNSNTPIIEAKVVTVNNVIDLCDDHNSPKHTNKSLPNTLKLPHFDLTPIQLSKPPNVRTSNNRTCKLQKKQTKISKNAISLIDDDKLYEAVRRHTHFEQNSKQKCKLSQIPPLLPPIHKNTLASSQKSDFSHFAHSENKFTTSDFKQMQIEKEKRVCLEWMNVSFATDCAFDTLRSERQCISNYVIRKREINKAWLNAGQSVQKETNYRIKSMGIKNHKYCGERAVKFNWFDVDDHEVSEEYVGLHRINLNSSIISLECPHCKLCLQCIPLHNVKEDETECVAFICFNFPRCQWPLNLSEYQSKYIWKNVLFVGASMSSQYENSFLFDKGENATQCLTYREVNLLSFANNRNEYMQWKRSQDRMSKKMIKRIKWKKQRRFERNNALKAKYKELVKAKNKKEQFEEFKKKQREKRQNAKEIIVL